MTNAGLILRATVLDSEAANSRNEAVTPVDRILQKDLQIGPSRQRAF
jgi:hypothetical protein